jgi:hypothetical protein
MLPPPYTYLHANSACSNLEKRHTCEQCQGACLCAQHVMNGMQWARSVLQAVPGFYLPPIHMHAQSLMHKYNMPITPHNCA